MTLARRLTPLIMWVSSWYCILAASSACLTHESVPFSYLILPWPSATPLALPAFLILMIEVTKLKWWADFWRSYSHVLAAWIPTPLIIFCTSIWYYGYLNAYFTISSVLCSAECAPEASKIEDAMSNHNSIVHKGTVLVSCRSLSISEQYVIRLDLRTEWWRLTRIAYYVG